MREPQTASVSAGMESLCLGSGSSAMAGVGPTEDERCGTDSPEGAPGGKKVLEAGEAKGKRK